MAIISFWSNGKEEVGKTSNIVAITTLLGINHNYKILVLDTKYNDSFYEDCYWQEDKTIKLINNYQINIESGIGGLSKAILSNKISPEIITNYTRIVFKDRLEILTDNTVQTEEYEKHKKIFTDIAKIANKYYDLVFIDIDAQLDERTKHLLLEISDLIIACLPQKIKRINDYMQIKKSNPIFIEKQIIPLLGRYDKHSKYNVKNVGRYIKEKRGIYSISYNTLFFEACNEGKVVDFFIKFRKINAKDRNATFISEITEVTEEIIERLKELQKRI
ncbi:MAG: hypothetical protein Q4G09_01135 [Clostridia bacterium]|nr:hypothetical protein [Clostridia bacterium]